MAGRTGADGDVAGADRHVVGDAPVTHADQPVQGELRRIDHAIAGLHAHVELGRVHPGIDGGSRGNGHAQARDLERGQRATGMVAGGIHVHQVAGQHEAVPAPPDIDETAELKVFQDVGEGLVQVQARGLAERRDISFQACRPQVRVTCKAQVDPCAGEAAGRCAWSFPVGSACAAGAPDRTSAVARLTASRFIGGFPWWEEEDSWLRPSCRQ